MTDDWSAWHDGFPLFVILGDAQCHTARIGDQVITQHRWRRYKHEAELLALLAGSLRITATRPGPTRPREGA